MRCSPLVMTINIDKAISMNSYIIFKTNMKYMMVDMNKHHVQLLKYFCRQDIMKSPNNIPVPS